MTNLDYTVLDVFAEQPLTGNPLAVFHDGTDLDTATMQAIAREMNLSETTFLLPRPAVVEAERGVRVRIFTTEEELPFAGHPTLGTATWLHLHHPVLRGARTVRLELNVGPIPVEFASPEPGRPGYFATMRQNDPQFLPRSQTWPKVSEIAEALGLTIDDLGIPGRPEARIETVSTGNPFCIVPVRDLEALGRLAISMGRARPLLGRVGARFFFCLAPNVDAADAPWRGRMQFGNGEDPATGSAAGCVAAWLVRHGLSPSGEDILMEQGIEMMRPSRLTLRASRTPGGQIADVFVGGRTIPVASGQLFRQ